MTRSCVTYAGFTPGMLERLHSKLLEVWVLLKSYRAGSALAVLLFCSLTASAATLVSNTANAPGSNLSPQSTFWLAEKFTTDAESWTITSAQFRGAKNNAGQPITLAIYSHDSVNDTPLASVGTFDTSTVTATIGVQSAAAVGTIALAPSTSYWFVFAPGDVNTAFWTQTADSTTTGPGTIEARVTFSTTGGASWGVASLSGNYLMMGFDGTSAPVSDTTPDAFTFTDQTNVALSATITSAPVTISGINAPSVISVVGGLYSINGGAFTSAGGTVSNGDMVRAQHTSSGSFTTTTDTTVTIGGVSDTFSSTTLAPDTTPDAFSFTDQT
ncbi:MAG: choice-of-anchor R domain-containing protein, partial [Acidobacteriota bacterium]